jgi:hypothetical protein
MAKQYKLTGWNSEIKSDFLYPKEYRNQLGFEFPIVVEPVDASETNEIKMDVKIPLKVGFEYIWLQRFNYEPIVE